LGPALQLLNALNQLADRTHTTRHKVELLALRAVALDAMGDSEQAEGELEQALQLARPGGFVRAFVDLGQRMSAVLSRLEAQGRNVEATRRMLAEFHSGDVATGEGLKTADATPHPALVSEPLVEPLTRRELEVLAFLQLPLSIQEVALKLNVSYATAKRHTINIYGKLGVNGRWAAVARAEELNILPPR
jgi:LuxR family maltose regulon positive regulatory protein